jgi:molybdopterin-containing oxidoreductase family iron-sulfur binding subunit
MKRRDFLTVVGAAGAGMATAGCTTRTNRQENFLADVRPSEQIVHGVPTWYTTTCRECPAGCGLHVETHEGRATKVEGNPNHPINHGNTCPRGQASVQGLYHPDRYKGPFLREKSVGGAARQVNWSVAQNEVAQAIRAAGAGGTAMLTSSMGPTMTRLVDDFMRAVGGRRVEWGLLDDAPRDLVFSDADVLVSFGADFLETWGSPVDYSYQFAEMHSYRKGRAGKGRFIWVGPHRPLTGLNADLWLPAKPGTEALVAAAFAGGVDVAAVAREADVEPAKLQRAIQWWNEGRRKVAMGAGTGPNAGALRQAVARLNGRPATGPTPTTDLRPVQQLVADMNAGRIKVLLVGNWVNPLYTLPGGLGFAEALKKVPVVVAFSPFPNDTTAEATHILPDHHFLEAWDDYVPRPGVFEIVQPVMKPVFNTKQTGDVLLGVASILGVRLPGAAAAVAAATGPAAPAVTNPAPGEPPAGSVAGPATAASPLGAPVTYFDYLRAAWAGRAPTVEAWRDAVRDGGEWGSLPSAAIPTVQGMVTPQAGDRAIPGGGAGGQAPAGVVAAPVPAPVQAPLAAAPVAAPVAAPAEYRAVQWEGNNEGLFLVAYPSIRFYDGRTGNRPWLLELPDPVTKVSWDSWVEMHPETAARANLEQGTVVKVESPHGEFEAPLYVWPGVRRDTVAVQMGLGQKNAGRFNADRGVNPMALMGAQMEPGTGTYAPATRVVVTNANRSLGRWDGLFEQGVRIQYDRAIAQAVGLTALQALESQGEGYIPGSEKKIEELRETGGFGPVARTTDPASYPPAGTEYGQYIEGETRWGMVIDLDRCTGCSACTIACYAENNIPVVGPKEMKRGRELSWLRIERYFGAGKAEDEAYRDTGTDDTRFLPMLCQHCGSAPCEPVCPVYAAYHTPDGLNGQVYNRCVGTRYCANNCPWKVRVFNWFTYEFAEPLHLQLNPDVTVREKGVMEKCSFCVQRIHEKERQANQENRRVRDGEVVPACVQACPTEVFAFGNYQDPESAVSKIAKTNRSYRSLGELNTKPAIVYLKKVTWDEGGKQPPSNGSFHQEKPARMGGDEHTPQGGVGNASEGAH